MPDPIDPTPNYAFTVQLQGTVVGWFTACSGLTLERTVIAQPEGGVNDYVPQLPGALSGLRLTLQHGLADNALWDWFQAGLYDGQVERRNVTVVLYAPDRTEVRRWDLTNAYPVRWSGLDFKADSDQLSVETLEIATGGSASAPALVQRALGAEDRSGAATVLGAAAVPEAAVDLPALAQRIYALLKHDARIERERAGRPRP